MIYVVLPAFDEEDAIGPAVAALSGAATPGLGTLTAVLVDDGSRDRTVERAEASAAKSGVRLQVLRHGENRGLGAALRTGLYWCVERAADGDVIVTMDADNTHPPALIPGMVQKLDAGHDVVIASRYEAGAAVHGVPPHRRVLSDLSKILFQTLFPISGARDYTCCFRAYRVAVLRRAKRAYGEDLCTARGFEAVMDLLLRLRQLDVKVAEVPLQLEYAQRAPRSKMRIFRTMTRTLALLGRRFVERFGKHSKRAVRARLGDGEGSSR